MDDFNFDVYERPIRNGRLVFTICAGLAAGIPLAALVICYWYGNPVSWVSRSGAISAAFAFLANYAAQSMSDVLLPNGMAGHTLGDLPQKYGGQILFLKRFSLALGLMGTAVWGFGDLIPLHQL